MTISTLHLSPTRDSTWLMPWKLLTLIAAIGKKLDQEWVKPKHAAHQQHAAVAILHIGRVNHGKQQQPLRVYQDMALLALDFLACIIARRINTGPPFSALLTLWLSMIAAVGLAWRSACSRQEIYKA
jgi:hypothetical protein